MNCTSKIIELETALRNLMENFLNVVETVNVNQESLNTLSHQIENIQEVMVKGGIAKFAPDHD